MELGDLVAYYVLSASEGSAVLPDKSGNGHDAVIHGAKFSVDVPLTECIKEQKHLTKHSDMTEYCTKHDHRGNTAGILVGVLLVVAIGLGGRHFWKHRSPIQKGDGLHASIFSPDATASVSPSLPRGRLAEARCSRCLASDSTCQ